MKIAQTFFYNSEYENIKIHASGRTDAKVHAINQKAHFDLNMDIDNYNLKKALNSLTNSDIYIKKIEKVNNDFHARFDVLEKIYISCAKKSGNISRFTKDGANECIKYSNSTPEGYTYIYIENNEKDIKGEYKDGLKNKNRL